MVERPPENPSHPVPPVTPEQQSDEAELLPMCEFPEIQMAGWTEHYFAQKFRVVLPSDFVGQSSIESEEHEQQLWFAPDGSLFLMTRHLGDGRAATRIGFDSPGILADEETCRISVLGRSALLSTWRLTDSGRILYGAAADVGVRTNLGIGVAFYAVTPERRAELLAAVRAISER